MRLALSTALTVCLFGLMQPAVACAQLSANVWMCDRGTIWENARWDTEGDGNTRFLGRFIFNFTEEWPGFDIGLDDSTLEEQFATYAEWIAADGGSPVEVLQVDQIETDHATALRHLQRDRVDGDDTMSAVMLAQVSDARIMLYLDGPAHTPLKEIEAVSRQVAELLRDHCADAVSCASDTSAKVATE